MNTTTLSILALFATACLLAPAASATGALVRVESAMIVSMSFATGSNVAGGSGETVDIGLGNHQCSDEEDVVDIGVFNREGDAQCGWEQGCRHETGRQILPAPIDNNLVTPAESKGEAHCSDDDDTVDVGVMNQEGSFENGEGCEYRDAQEWPYGYPRGGDVGDAVDVGVMNVEVCDESDADDLGIANCEYWDSDDGIDVSVLGFEFMRDQGDTFDLAVFAYEDLDSPDHNGLNVGSSLGLFLCETRPVIKGIGGDEVGIPI